MEDPGSDGEISKETMRYYEMLDKYERILLNEIPDILESLEKKFEFRST